MITVLNKVPKGSYDMNSIPAQELKRRGIAAVDDLVAKGDLHVIRNNQPQYVVLSEERYQELIVAEQEAYYARVRASLEDLKEGRVKRGSAEDLIKELKLEG
jgi:PHD/YefM family antitoxin component YafN of YafNO toxin-antitoxin module